MDTDKDQKYLEMRLNAAYENLRRAVTNFNIDDQTLAAMRKEAIDIFQQVETHNRLIAAEAEAKQHIVAAWSDHLKTYQSFIWLLKASAGFCVVALVGLYLCFGR
jgi:hypothetical protein